MKTKYTLPVVAATAVMATPIYAYAAVQFDFSFTGNSDYTVTGELFFADTSNGLQTPTDVVITSGGNVTVSTPFDMGGLNLFAPTNTSYSNGYGGFDFSNGNITGGNFYIAKSLYGLVLNGVDSGTNAFWQIEGNSTRNNAETGGFQGATYTSAPEPASIALLGAGIAGIASFRRRRVRTRA